MLANLLDNAVKFTPEGGTVTLGVCGEAGRAVASVSDTGVGIPAEEQGAVFERLHRARNASAYPGSGLGLPIVQAVVERAGRTVSLASSPAAARSR